MFAAGEGADRVPVELADGSWAMVRVDAIAAPRDPAFEEVTDSVAAAWEAEQIAAALDALAAELAAEAAAAEGGLDAVAAARGAEIETIDAFPRNGFRPPLQAALVSELFRAEPGGTSHGPAEGSDAVLVVQLAEIVPATDEDIVAEAARIEIDFTQALQIDMEAYFGRALEARFQPTYQPGAVDDVFRTLSRQY